MPCPRVFVESLATSGIDADLVIFYRDVSSETLSYLRSAGAKLVRFRMWRHWHGAVHAWRFVLFARYAEAHFSEYDWIMTTDIRDVLVQSDPFAGLDRRVNFFLENAAYTIATEKFYAQWMRVFVEPRYHDACGAGRISCCGVVAGGATEMRDYLLAIAKRIKSVSLRNRRKIGADSAFHNLIAHVTHEVPSILVENNLHVATMALEPRGTYHVNSVGLIAVDGGHVPPVCHQYDRLPGLFAASRYAQLAS
jgi:hypothetical protein